MQNTEKNLENGSLFPVTQNAIQTYVNSNEHFPVPFDEFWQWVGYSTKQKAEQTLNKNFDEGIDFLTLGLKSSNGGRPAKNIMLSIDCAKSFAMLAQTDKGKQIRLYFLDCEKKLNEIQKNPQHQLLPAEIQKILLKISFLEAENEKHQKFQERLFHIENILDNRPYIPHKTAIPLLKYYVYFAFNPDNNLTKIGRSHEPENRLKTFKAISPNVDMTLVINVANLKVSCELETFLHALFAKKHKSGEIFELSDTDFKMIELLKDAIEAFN